MIPAVVSSHGSWHPEFAQWLRGAARAVAERAGPSVVSPQGMLWRCVGLFALTLHWQTFQVLAGCASMLEPEVQGQLGRPLSEVPEFWRVASEAAVLWGSEEFGHSPSPRGGSLELADPDTDLPPSGAGHLRMAGVRL